MTLEDTRHSFCNIKSLNLLSAVIASMKSIEAGVDEAVLYRDKYVTECTHSNIFIITENNELKTAPISSNVLPGVSRAHLIGAAKLLGIPVIEESFTIDELFSAKEIIVTASGALCRPVCKIDGKDVGGRAQDILCNLRDLVTNDFLNKTGK
jgi:D-alanine transaminase